MEQEKIVKLIQNLLALSQSPNEHEASLAMNKAQDLLIKYNLDMDSITDKPVQGDDESTLMNEVVEFDGVISWHRTLLTALCNRSFCHAIKSGNNIHILGRKANIRAVVTMYNWLEPQIIRLANRSPYKRLEKKSYILGIISTISKNMDANMAKHTANVNTKALVLNVQSEIDSYFKEQFPYTRLSRRTSIRIGAFEQGKHDGNKVSIYDNSKQVTSGKLLLK